ncbi:MAG: aspartyl protease family protein [Deltaproteobacteria bacterium]|jgi:clan AA aspartic protease (TIGR02281 family)|nr:aspartyl protease family protein [Deltaproteobacteria bacterium]MBW2542212.1 aspartyl protease family protein [Deltaproteobacteria bacterium]
MRRWAICLLALLLQTSDASAEIFRWTDEAGNLHFAQSIQQVPPRYRKQALEGSAAKSKSDGIFQTYTKSEHHPGSRAGGKYRVPFVAEGSLMRVTAIVNGHVEIPFLIDTGASGVSLPASAATRLGISIGPNTQRVTMQTANGAIELPLVRLASVELAGARVEGLMATLNPTMSIGLLGGAFFNQFNYRVDPAANVITLERNHAPAVPNQGEEHWRRRFRQVREPLEQLETYLRNREGLNETRREELEQKRLELEARLNALEREANRDSVPRAWRR